MLPTHRHAQDELEDGQPDGRCIDEATSSKDKISEGPLAGVARLKAFVVGVIILDERCGVLDGVHSRCHALCEGSRQIVGASGETCASRGWLLVEVIARSGPG
jgi:hypothetical protein